MKYIFILLLFGSCIPEENIAPSNLVPVKVIAYEDARLVFTVGNDTFTKDYKANDYQYRIVNLPKGTVYYNAYYSNRWVFGQFINDGNKEVVLCQ